MQDSQPDTGNKKLDTLLMLCEVRGFSLQYKHGAFRSATEPGGVARVTLTMTKPPRLAFDVYPGHPEVVWRLQQILGVINHGQ